MAIREPFVAGQFYSASPRALQAEIMGFADESLSREEVIGVVLPHAGYLYSGGVTGAVVSSIVMKDTFVILGPNHSGRGRPFSMMTEGSWKTPLGEVSVNSELAGRILAGSRHLEEDVVAHLFEHSIEVQLPFLQYFKPDVRIVPIMLGQASAAVYKEIGTEIAAAVKESLTDTIIAASTDMTHYEPHDSAKAKDARAIQAILRLDEDDLMRLVHGLKISMCGYAPTIALISAAKHLGAAEARLVKYSTSGDVMGDYTSVVGYAGIIIPRPGEG